MPITTIAITTTTTCITGISDVLPDSGLLRVLQSALLQAGGCPTQFLFVSKAAFASSIISRGLRIAENTWHSHHFARRREEPDVLSVFRGRVWKHRQEHQCPVCAEWLLRFEDGRERMQRNGRGLEQSGESHSLPWTPVTRSSG